MSRDARQRAWHPATRLAALPLGVITCYVLPVWALPLAVAALFFGLTRAGLSPASQAAALRPWLWVGLLVLALHTFTTVAAAPLGRPSWAGLVRGLSVVGRVAAMIGCLMLARRVIRPDDLVAGLAWWTWPLWRGRGQPVSLALSLVVAAGVVPGAVSEARRLSAMSRLRRAGRLPRRRWRRWGQRLLDQGYVVLPMMESLFRRAETLPVALSGRLPLLAAVSRPPLWQLGGLLAWTMSLVAAVVR
jgi:energy-coupling factor transporter transmembrane protein EcfT